MHGSFRVLVTFVLSLSLTFVATSVPAGAVEPGGTSDGTGAPRAAVALQKWVGKPPVGTLIASGPGWSLYVESSAALSSEFATSSGEGGMTPMLVSNCGVATCSVYLSRAQTKAANNNIYVYGGGIAGLAAACGFISLLGGPAAPVIAVSCGVAISVEGGFLLNAISRAASDNGCLRIRYGAFPTAYYNDHSSYCHNN